MNEPNAIVLYVDDVRVSSKFYQDLLGIEPIEASLTFHSFQLSNGMGLGLKDKQTAVPPFDKENGSGELVFTLKNNEEVDALFSSWQKKEMSISLPPTDVTYGYTFLALDPDGNRLRVVSLNQS